MNLIHIDTIEFIVGIYMCMLSLGRCNIELSKHERVNQYSNYMN